MAQSKKFSDFYRLVSDDNPYSESLFKTLKYHPNFPMTEKFENIQGARVWAEKFVSWYNTKHLHSALKFVTPLQRHTGEDFAILDKRHEVYEKSKAKHPEILIKNVRTLTTITRRLETLLKLI